MLVSQITAKAYLISSGTLDGPILAICLAKVGNFVSMALSFIEERLLSNTLDVTSRFIFRVAEFLDRLHPLVDATAQGIIYDNLQCLHTSCANASIAQEDTPEAYCARFLALLLARLGSNRGAPPHPVHQAQSHQPVHDNVVPTEGSGIARSEQMSPNVSLLHLFYPLNMCQSDGSTVFLSAVYCRHAGAGRSLQHRLLRCFILVPLAISALY